MENILPPGAGDDIDNIVYCFASFFLFLTRATHGRGIRKVYSMHQSISREVASHDSLNPTTIRLLYTSNLKKLCI